MMSIDPQSATRVVTELLGFRPEPTRLDDVVKAVAERLKRRAASDIGEYLSLLDDPVSRSVEARALADKLTINETYFFREDAHNAVLRNVVLPEFRDRGHRPLRVLSLGCSSGEEPYGVALTLSECGWTRNEARIIAVDASAAAIDRAERARFSAWSLRNVDEVRRRKYFAQANGGFELVPNVKSWVRFAVSNFLDRDPGVFEPESYDVVFCRNVLIYFTPDVVKQVIDDIFRSLRPGGFLFLGHAETGHAGRRFDAHDASGAFYFTKRRNSEIPTIKIGRRAPETQAQEAERAANVVSIATRRTDRPKAPATPVPAAPDPRVALDSSIRALRSERFAEAMTLLEDAPRCREREVVRATILTNRGELAAARDVCSGLVGDYGDDAETHYLLGLCAELEKRPDRAREAYMRASLLDEDFAMPRLRLGMLARRGRQVEDARRFLGDALRLFPYQTERVLLLFGGGFQVDGLTRLCRTEIDACAKTS